MIVDWRDRSATLTHTNSPAVGWHDFAEIGDLHRALQLLAGKWVLEGASLESLAVALAPYHSPGHEPAKALEGARAYLLQLVEFSHAIFLDDDREIIYYGSRIEHQRHTYYASRG